MADEALGQSCPIGVHHFAVSLQVAMATEAAAAEVAGEWPQLAVDQRVARQQGPELEDLAADGTGECIVNRGAPPPAGGMQHIAGLRLQVHTHVVLLQAGGTLEAAQADVAAVRFVTCVATSMSGEEHLRLQALTADTAGKRCIRWQVLLTIHVVGVHQDLMAFELVLASKLPAADVTQVRPLTSVRLEVDGELRLAFKLFSAEVAKQ